MRDQSRIRATMLGGAIGDAFGYPVEFLTFEQIQKKYGKDGILGYDLTNGYAEISDDTQLSLYTANGLLLGKTRGCMRGVMGPYAGYLTIAYLDWIKTQRMVQQNSAQKAYCWLNQVPELHHRRAPAVTCIQVLSDKAIGTIEHPTNSSKVSAGVMRVAPIGAFFDPRQMPQTEIDRLGAEAAAITHGNVAGWMPAAALVHMINCIIYCGATHDDWPDLIDDTVRAMLHGFSSYPADGIVTPLKKALSLARSSLPDRQALQMLGEGWNGPEALAMAVFCAVRYGADFESSVIAAVNHDGDSDTVASICGNLQGAMLGMEGLPEYDLEPLELRGVIDEIARDLWCDCRMQKDSNFYDEDWSRKYLEGRWAE